jgi:hypothetical protein
MSRLDTRVGMGSMAILAVWVGWHIVTVRLNTTVEV